MNKTEVIARRILGWKVNCWDSWYDYEKDVFIHDSDFQPEKIIDHAMLIVKRLEKFGFTYTTNGDTEVSFKTVFKDIRATGDTLAQAITNAAYAIADNSTINEAWM